jgi:CDP-paratose 2-epimerase
MKILVTGAGGLIGSEAVEHFCRSGHDVHGIENNQRMAFFGEQGSTVARLTSVQSAHPRFQNHAVDIRDRNKIQDLFKAHRFQAVVHTAAQPSHDRAAAIPFDDFETNATGTLNLLEAVRNSNPEAVFVHMSTNKVYGDRPNTLALTEKPTRFDYAEEAYYGGIDENFSIDQSTHSLFGASKLAADILVQEYGRYFQIPSCVLRGGCLTGENHSGVALHGFLNYLIKCNVLGIRYKVFGYKGKQVRDNIHSADVAAFIDLFIANPRFGEVYNIGGGKENSCSVLEAFTLAEKVSGKRMVYEYVDQNRIGDHICYYSNLSKIKRHYPDFQVNRSLESIFESIFRSCIK